MGNSQTKQITVNGYDGKDESINAYYYSSKETLENLFIGNYMDFYYHGKKHYSHYNLMTNKLLISGYFRQIFIDNTCYDYPTIYTIINLYYFEGYATYFDNINECRHKLQFGDIFSRNLVNKRQETEFFVRTYDIANPDIRAGEIFKQRSYWNRIRSINCHIIIPKHVCQNLKNAPEFYSRLCSEYMRLNSINRYSEFIVELFVRMDDEFVIQQLGASLNPNEYISCKLTFQNDQFIEYTIKSRYYAARFNPNQYSYSYRDIDEFFELRKYPHLMVNIKVVPAEFHKFSKEHPNIYSARWQVKIFETSMLNGAGYLNYERNISTEGYCYIGPREERKNMIQMIDKFYVGKCEIFMVDLNRSDYCIDTN